MRRNRAPGPEEGRTEDGGTRVEARRLPSLTRRRFLLGLALAAASGLSPWKARAGGRDCASLAGRRIRWVVPNSQGGGYDTYSRLIAPHFAEKLDAEIVVENIPGAGGIIGADHIRKAPPDGLTIGILNGPGMLMAGLIGEKQAPDLPSDFTFLGRIARSQHVWAAGGDSPLRTIGDALAAARERPLLFAIDEVASTSFVCATLASSLLPVEVAFLSGFSGSRQTSLAAMRGDADLVSHSFESIRGRIEAGDLRPLLQFGTAPIADHPSLKGVPLFGGPSGLAAGFASARGVTAGEAEADARAMVALLGVGRLVVAPRDLPPGLFACLEQYLHDALGMPAFREAAANSGRSLDVARSDEVEAELRLIEERSAEFLPVLRGGLEKARR